VGEQTLLMPSINVTCLSSVQFPSDIIIIIVNIMAFRGAKESINDTAKRVFCQTLIIIGRTGIFNNI